MRSLPCSRGVRWLARYVQGSERGMSETVQIHVAIYVADSFATGVLERMQIRVSRGRV